jgi:hypothetical protein
MNWKALEGPLPGREADEFELDNAEGDKHTRSGHVAGPNSKTRFVSSSGMTVPKPRRT